MGRLNTVVAVAVLVALLAEVLTYYEARGVNSIFRALQSIDTRQR